LKGQADVQNLRLQSREERLEKNKWQKEREKRKKEIASNP
jgi:hypothetical protein